MTLSGLSLQMNLKNKDGMSLTSLCDKFDKADNDCTKIGSTNDFMTVIFPIIDIAISIAVSFSAEFSSKKLFFFRKSPRA